MKSAAKAGQAGLRLAGEGERGGYIEEGGLNTTRLATGTVALSLSRLINLHFVVVAFDIDFIAV